uniref:annexin A9 n=1 Tax=Panthera onca TaxID=9690 RepID=UPI0029552FF2|nr:annexin A9 [Panthera onca]
MGGEPRGLGVIKRPKGPEGSPQLAPISLPGIASDTMSVTSGKTRPSLTQEILSHLGLANKTAAWGTLGTLRTFLSFSVDKDVQRLLRAIASQGEPFSLCTWGSSLQEPVCRPRRSQEGGSDDLVKSLQAALSGNLERMVMALLQPAAHFDAQELRTALKNPGSTEDVAVEILATRSPPQLQECLTVYKHNFQMEVEKDIKSETSGILRDLLLALAKGARESYSGIIDYNLVEDDVQALKQAEGPGTEGTWVIIFTQRNPEHLVRVFDQYQRCSGHELEKTIQNIFHGDDQAALLSLVSVIKNTPLYFADKLHQALQDMGPNYQVLMRILISRSETDLLSIRAEFKKKFGKSLYSSLQDAVKGDCRSALLALCRAEDL